MRYRPGVFWHLCLWVDETDGLQGDRRLSSLIFMRWRLPSASSGFAAGISTGEPANIE